MGDDLVGYLDTWKVLEEIVIEFRKKGVAVPERIMTDLRSAKTMIKLAEVAEKDKGEISPKLEQCLTNVEGYLITEAQNIFPERVDDWLRRLDQPVCAACIPTSQTKEERRFISGIPRHQKWIRVKPIAGLPIEKLKMLAHEAKLSYKRDKEGQLIIYGEAENIKKFVGLMTKQKAKE